MQLTKKYMNPTILSFLTKSTVLMIVLFAVIPTALIAQQEELEGSQVEIIKTFEATIEDAQIIKLNPVIPYPLPVNRTYKYEITVVQLPLKYPEPTIQALAMKPDEPFDRKNFYAKAGYGSLSNPFANVRYSHSSSDIYAFDVALNHFSLDNSSSVDFQKMSTTDGEINAKFRMGENIHLHAGINAMFDKRFLYYTFRDFSSIEDENELKRNHNRYGYKVGISNIENTSSGINYAVFLNQNLTSLSNPSVNELNTLINGYVEKRNTDKINIELPFSAHFTNYRPEDTRINFYTLNLKPRLNFHAGKFQATIGGNLLHDNTGTSPFPEVQFAYGLLSNYVQILLGVDQSHHTNNMAMTLQTTPWTTGHLDTILNTISQNFYGGLRGNLSFVNYQAKAGLRNFKNIALFQSTGVNGLVNLLYDQVSSVFISGNIDFAYSDKLSIGGELTRHFFNPDNQERMWGVPTTELRAYSLFKPFGPAVDIKGELFFRNRNYTLDQQGEEIRLNNLIELNAGIQYTFKKKIAVFADANNILNVKYQRWHGFPTVGINLAAGIVVSL